MTFVFLLTFLGLLFLYLEFFLPGGIMGAVGGLLILSSIIFLFFQDISFWGALGYIVFLVLLIVCVCKFALWRIKMSGHKTSFYLAKDQEGYRSSTWDTSFVGKMAVAASDLKPSGHILVDGEPWQAVSESGYILKGQDVLITGGEGAHYIVSLKK